MKKIIRITMSAAFALVLGTMSSCKKETTTNETETTAVTTDTTVVAPTDTAPAQVNDTNVSGVTSGKMEQVP